MDILVTISIVDDIFPKYCDTPIGRFLEYHNLERSYDS